MRGKTITLDADAYQRLKTRKRPGETFSSVVRRARFADSAPTGEDLLAWCNRGSSPIPEKYLSSVQDAADQDLPPDDPWS
ncbi:MAG: antitoxin VapB family protein [Opitutales bacterium]